MIIKLAMIHIIGATLVTYLFIQFFGRKLPPSIILVSTIIQLSYLHLTKQDQTKGGWSLDISVIYMMSICKFSSLAFSYDDGGKRDHYNQYYLKK